VSRALAIGLGVAAGVGIALALRGDGPAEACDLLPVGRAGGLLYRSQGERSQAPVIVLHGRGGNAEAIAEAVPASELEAFGFYPQAQKALGASGNNFAWTAARFRDDDWAERQAEAVSAILPFVEWVKACMGAPVIAGHSQGAHMAYAVAAKAPGLVRGAVGASGALTPVLSAPLKVPVVAIHGAADTIVPPDNARGMGALGARFIELPGAGHSLDGELLRVFKHELDLVLV